MHEHRCHQKVLSAPERYRYAPPPLRCLRVLDLRL